MKFTPANLLLSRQKKKFVEANQSVQSLPRLIVQYAVTNRGHPADRRKPAVIVPDDRGLMLCFDIPGSMPWGFPRDKKGYLYHNRYRRIGYDRKKLFRRCAQVCTRRKRKSNLECCEALAELLALCDAVVVRGFVEDEALIGVDDCVCIVGTLYPVTHPLTVAPAVGAEQ